MKKKKKNLLQSYKVYTLVPAIIMAVVVTITITMVSLYFATGNMAFLVIFDVIAVLTLVLYILFYFRLSKKLRNTFYKQLFETTYTNISKISKNDVNLVSYGDSDIKEIQMLDKATMDIKAKLDSSFLVLKKADYSSINLEYVDKDNGVITYDSFKHNISNILFVSQSFRNVIVEVFFDFPKDINIPKKDQKRLLALYQNTFKEHDHVLYCFGKDYKSLLIYIPVIDSFTEIKEKLNLVVTKSSIMIRDEKGIQNILAKYAIVAYPYSNEDMILGDLKYAKRANKPFNLYLPIRHQNNVDKKLLMNTSMNLNYTSKITNVLSKLDYSAINNEANDQLLKEVFEAVANFIDIDDAGIIAYNDATDEYYSYISSNRSSLFVHQNIRKDFIEKLGSVSDEDDVYYFSSRNHASMKLQETLGLYGIQSGIYYVVRSIENNKIIALIYALNTDKNMYLNTYLRETFFMISLRIENYFEKREIADYADDKEAENENILSLADMFVYHIDDDFNITYLSHNMKKLFSHLSKGKKCYEAMFGLDSPCKDCPLRKKKKKYFEIGDNKYEVSLTLMDKRDENNILFIKRIKQDEVYGDLYQEDYLTYSYKALYNAIKNEYVSSARGYLLLLCIDNYDKVITKIGPEGFNYLIRDYVRSLKNKMQIDDIYYYNASTLAIHLPSMGHKDILTIIENIYPLSKSSYYENDDFTPLNITYLPIGYPRGYAYTEDYLKHVSDFYHEKHERNKDFIYFADYPIERSASKREFMLATLVSEFSGHNSTSMNLQPIVRVKDGHIFGAEILLRIADAHRNVFFNAQEISTIAEQEHKTGLITESIINFIGNMYKEYGKNIFKINEFNRIAINIDQTYLEDKELLPNLIHICEENNLPNGFISLEIPEEMIPDNKGKIKALASQLEKYKILFSVDRYIGQYIDIEELSFLGFKEVKIARDLILSIDRDREKYASVKDIVNNAKAYKVGVSAVGVENEIQYRMLRDLDEDMMAQGYYLYKPLTRADLIAALISYEK